MSGRAENKQKSIDRMRAILQDKPEYLTGFYNSLLTPREYLTAQNYTLTVLRFMKYINTFDLSAFTEDNIDSYTLSLKGRKKNECSDSAKATAYYALSKFGEYLLKRKLISENPVKNIDRIAIKDTPEKIAMNPDELKKVLQNIKSNTLGNVRQKGRRKPWISRNYAIMTLLMTTGMRVTALTEINLSDYNCENKTLTVVDKRRTHIDYILEDGTVAALNEWIRERDKIMNGSVGEALFISNRKSRMTSKAVRDLVSIYTQDLDKHITPHKFRSSFATNLYEQTGDIYLVQEAMKHRRPDTTEKYIKSHKNQSLDAGNMMRKLLES